MPVGGGRARPSTCTPSTARWEAAARPAGPGRASRRRAERSSRRGRRAGGQAPRRSEIRRPGPKAPGTPAEHTKYRPIGGRRNPAGVKGAGGSGGHGRASRRRAERSSRRGRRAGGQAPRRSEIRRAAGPEGARNTGGAHQVPPDGRLPQPRQCEGRRRTGLRCPWVAAGPGRASRRRAEPKARGADGERAGRRPRAHKAARRANCLYSPPTPGSGRPV